MKSSKFLSFPKDKFRILLLEGVHSSATKTFSASGYNIESRKDAMSKEDLLDAISEVQILGIRSKTQLSAEILAKGKRLLAVGCFCIGTNQVDLVEARRRGIAVFNAPFSNTRSVAELTMAEVVMLARRASEKNIRIHRGEWDKSAEHCYEVRGKTLGIIGYGHIGPQVGLLAEAFGMKVVFFDIVKRLPLGSAVSLHSLGELLDMSDFVTLHVPETEQTKGLIGRDQLEGMKRGACLLNLSRGSVVDINALRDMLKSGQIGGAAIDVFPAEPRGNGKFDSPLCGLDNAILTPHIGGSTEEAQRSIGVEVADSLIRYVDTGSSSQVVNFPEVDLPLQGEVHRILNIHKNVPGVLGKINRIIAEIGVNISAQYLNTKEDVGYLIIDMNRELSDAVKQQIAKLPESIKTRVLF